MTAHPLHAHYSDADLLAWLEGNKEFRTHIEQCEACRQRAMLLLFEEKRLQSLLFRADCPSPLTLANYELKQLSDESRRIVSAHIAQCPHCSQELAWLRQFMAAPISQTIPAPQEAPNPLNEVKESIRVIVARWVNQVTGGPGAGMGMQLAMGAMRGGGEQRPMLFDADELQVTLEFYEDQTHPGKHQLVGLLIGDEAPEHFRVQIWRDNTCLAETEVDELGNFTIDNLTPAMYDLKLIHPKLEVQLNALDI